MSAVRLSCFFNCRVRERSGQGALRCREAEAAAHNLPRSLLVCQLKLLHVEQLNIQLDELLQRDATLLVPHPLGQLPLRDLIDKPIQLLLNLVRAPLPSVPLTFAFKDLCFDPERKDLAPDVQIRLGSRGRRNVRDFSSKEFDRGCELLLLRDLESGKGGEGFGEEGEEFVVRVQRNEDLLPVLAVVVPSPVSLESVLPKKERSDRH